ncbi:ABC transporter B family member 25, mitochondrial-like isoform X2 [Hordeum vulgare subsp. vulgare]|nr:ABC transporter B family member 25, mitochondrial-like isoform X2 [Hordeum vulgare subsp. vulgare]
MTRLIEAGSLPSCHGEAVMWDGAMAVVLHPKAKMQEGPLNISSALGGAEASLASFTDANATLLALFASPGAVLIGYGIARSGVSACTELRNALFSKVTLRAIRSVSRMVFSHLHEFDLRYHLSRQTGALNRIIDRGSNAINFILTVTVFNIVPTILEV